MKLHPEEVLPRVKLVLTPEPEVRCSRVREHGHERLYVRDREGWVPGCKDGRQRRQVLAVWKTLVGPSHLKPHPPSRNTLHLVVRVTQSFESRTRLTIAEERDADIRDILAAQKTWNI